MPLESPDMYRAPLKDLQFVLHDLIGDADLQACRDLGDYSADLADSVLAEAGRFAESVLDPLYRTGDRDGAKWTPQGVVTPPGYKEAYAQFVEGGWPSLAHSTEFGGQGMPRVLATAVEEIWTSANCAFKLCPMLTHSAIEALEQVGTPGPAADLSAEADQRRVDRHDESHRAAGRLGPGAGAHARSARGRSLPAVRPEDLHHLRRARLHAEHRAPGARAHRRRAGRRERHFAVRRAEVPAARRRLARRAQRRALPVHRAQARHSRVADLRDGLWAEGRCDRLSGRRGERRPQAHVHHDERRAARGRAGRVMRSRSARSSRRRNGRARASRASRRSRRPMVRRRSFIIPT